MKKLIASLLLLGAMAGMAGMAGMASADQIPDTIIANGYAYKTLTSSGPVVSLSGTLYRVEMSTGNGQDWLQVIDTVAIANVTSYASFVSSTQFVTPQYVFTSTVTSVGASMPRNYVSFEPYGVRIKNGIYLFLNTGVNQATVYYKR